MGTQGIAGLLQVFETLLVAFLLFTQLGFEARGLGLQTALLRLAGSALQVPGVGGITGIVPLDLQQLQLSPLGCQLRLLEGIGFAEITDFITTGVELRLQTGLGQLCCVQTLFKQGALAMTCSMPTLELHDPHQARHRARHQTQQNAGQIHCHAYPGHCLANSLKLNSLTGRLPVPPSQAGIVSAQTTDAATGGPPGTPSRPPTPASCGPVRAQRPGTHGHTPPGHGSRRRVRPDVAGHGRCADHGRSRNRGRASAPGGFAPPRHLRALDA
ncbi:hypothetical protein EDP1_4014 [Pseudomonas putida S610]|nr:hypothetical protein EDP1_4014 [Pseudomonas putida S610]